MTDHGEIISEALRDSAGNGYRMEAAARAVQAFLFAEAARACDEAAKQGFPLAILSTGDARAARLRDLPTATYPRHLALGCTKHEPSVWPFEWRR